MAYIQESDITGLYTGTDALSIPSSTYDFITSQIDATFTTQFDLFDQTYYVQMGESTTTIALKTPLYAIDLANSYYTTNSLINPTTLDNIVPNDTSQKLSPIIYVKESTTKYPPITDEEPLIQGTDYYIKKASIVRINYYWKRFVEIRFVWGYRTVPTDVKMLASLMGYEFSLSSMSSTTQISERIGDYQYSSFKDSTTSGYSDNILNLTNTLRNKYSPPTFALTQELMNTSPIFNATGTAIQGLP